MVEWLEFIAVWMLVQVFGLTSRSLSRRLGALVGVLGYRFLGRLRQTGERNLELAYPRMDPAVRTDVLKKLYRNLGWQMAEFCQMPGYTLANSAGFLRCEGLEHYLAARDAGRGVLIVTGHLGAWELSSFYHSLMGYPMSMVIRRLDNARLDRYVNRIRCLHGNRVLHKDDFARGLIGAMRRGETVGILMDTNMTPPQGVFVDYFDQQACTASGLARVAAKTGAAVIPASCCGNSQRRRMFCVLVRSFDCCRAANLRRMQQPIRSSAPRQLSSGYGRIRTNGCGYIGDGRRGRRASRRFTSLGRAFASAADAATLRADADY